MNRRARVNQALERAIEVGNERRLPVLFYEGLTCTYPHANDRLHTFILDGVPETAKQCKERGIGYAFYLRRRKSDANDVLYRLAADAAMVVTDDYPTFIAAGHNASVPGKIRVAFEAVDASCIVPMNRHEKRNYGAYTIRPKIRKMLPEYLRPITEQSVGHRWRGAPPGDFHTNVSERNVAELVASCEIDHSVPPSLSYRGGQVEAERHLEYFLRENLRRYARERNEPASHATSNMSPYLHFGAISSLDVALRVKDHAARHHFIADEFLEELIVRRELAFNFARFTARQDSLDALPEWCRTTMREHAEDARGHVYTAKQMEAAETYDPLWNATQKELLLRGKIHGYYRMYWGKKMIEWSKTYEDALELMIRLHDVYALDGRDPNTYTNILWCFGLHDRPWGTRPVFGSLRYMSFEGMKRKTNVGAYMEEIAELERTGRDRWRLAGGNQPAAGSHPALHD
ncbi:MAG: Deoxyribodipyrimidine photo-lyase type [Bryobacterales bacterium]|nr:Deoxyribodipyrimidine photo-lyase type [Bryobacterales bacterium]